jgi:alpha-aminoadipate carrier protein LysW
MPADILHSLPETEYQLNTKGDDGEEYPDSNLQRVGGWCKPIGKLTGEKDPEPREERSSQYRSLVNLLCAVSDLVEPAGCPRDRARVCLHPKRLRTARCERTKVVPRLRMIRRCSSFTSSAFFVEMVTQRQQTPNTRREGRRKSMATCPECGGTVPIDNVERGEIVPCPDCGAELEVRELNPLTLTLAPEIQEDWGE